MEKKFAEVFPNLQLNEELSELLSKVTVAKVTVTSARDFLRVYLTSSVWIHKRYIYQLEQAIREQCFGEEPITVKIIEKFRLSGQYTPQNLYPLYRDSILEELKQYSAIEYSLLRRAQVEFPKPDLMALTVDRSVIAQGKAEELVRILEKIFGERCGLPMQIELREKEEQVSRERADSDLMIEREVEEIARRASAAEQGNDDELMIREGSDEKSGISAGKTAGRQTASGAGAYGSGAGASAKDRGSSAKAAAAKGPGTSERAASAKGAASAGTYGNGAGARAANGRGSAWRGNQGGDYRKPLRQSDNPDVLYGRDFDGDAISIVSIEGEIGEVVIRGQVRTVDFRELKSGKFLMTFDITDFTDTITVKLFLQEEQMQRLKESVTKGMFLKVKGVTNIDRFDSQLGIGSVAGIKKASDFRVGRMDHCPHKRVELHCHTKMSDMDGVSEVKDIVRQAYKWGHPAIAITDHGAVQAFPDANHVIEDIDRAYREEYQKDHPDVTKEELKKISHPFKVLYGVEGYLVDDLNDLVTNSRGQDLGCACVVFDLETTGFSPVNNRIIEIGAVKVENGVITDRFSTFVNPKTPIPFRIEQLTGISDSMVMSAPAIEEVLPKFLEFIGDAALAAHNASFDVSFLEENLRRLGCERTFTYADTVALARVLLPQLGRYKLDTLAKTLHVPLGNHHRAVDDAECTAGIYLKLMDMLKERGVRDFDGANELGRSSEEQIKKLPTYHVIILATNETGRVNLYRLVSFSHLQYFARRPRIPKSVLNQYREGLLVGSACEAGEVFRAVLEGKTEQELARLVSFYDYLEIQPIGNNEFLLREDHENVRTKEDLQELNRRIVKLGEEFHKPVVATCDVHFLNPEDEIYRRIIMAGKGFKDADQQAPLFLRTTEEMLEEFAYLGREKAEEVVITNTNKIADLCEKISPVRPDKCPPVIEDSDKTLREICYKRAHEIYGEELPPIVTERLERELHSIISNGFAVMYIIAQKLVWKSNEDGYLVGSRGSVGSSFVATMAGITEVNPLSPHYYCEDCHYYDFDSEEVKAFAGRAGCDMPDRLCPVCGAPLRKAGFDIPFETFLGFKGNKEPDIDLNFSGEYQANAHRYTEVIFGEGHTFRAGTVGTLADKTAFGYVKRYFEEHNQRKRNCEISRIVDGCVGVRRTTGQHPGGIIVLPHGEEIYSFTPIQHPANDTETDIITTHFDYHSIDHNLLKLDILGHDDPTMIRMLEDLTGLNARDIPLDDQGVMSLFQETDALGVTPEEILGCPLGSLGIPEFGTEFVIQMLQDTKPQSFSDLVRISGLSHGTDVWLGNAQTLIQEGKATISTAICTRDDIMTYLIQKGLDSEQSFTIMESVRKGKGLKPEWEQEMKEHGVPDWYIWSCKKIKYMFPKAHAAAYVMMAYRIAYCKVYYPLAYYAAYFSIRASAFNYELMCQGKERLLMYMDEYKKNYDQLTKKEQDTYKDMKSVQEMYARGFEFVPIDISKAKANRFQIVDGRLMPSLSTIDGLGEKAAEAVVEAVKDGPFLSKDDFWERTKVTKSVIDTMADLGLLGDLPESNQLSLFDF